MTYIFNSNTHSDYTLDYMNSLGLDDEQKESVLAMKELTALKLKDDAKLSRNDRINSDLVHKGVLFQVDSEGIANFNAAASTAHLSDDETGSVNWISSDNSIHELNYDDIKQIILKYNARKQSIFEKYTLWRAGDMSEKF